MPAKARPANSTSKKTDRAGERKLDPRDELLNDQIHAVLRDAAELREGRANAQRTADTDAARRQLESVLALSRERHGRSDGQNRPRG
jgi:hypothetical protein